MEILFLCGVFDQENEKEVILNAKRPVEFSANTFQKKIVHGLVKNEYNHKVISAPFIGSYPNASKKVRFDGFTKEQQKYKYVHFNNIWGIRNLSRARALKRSIDYFIEIEDSSKIILVYSPHTPFLEAAVYAKKKDSSIRICLIVPDLPQFMNLSQNVSLIYRIGKKYDIAKFNNLNKYVDGYLILTEFMKEYLSISSRPYIVVEGIVDFDDLRESFISEKDDDKIKIVYTGKLNKEFGIIELVDAFMKLEDSRYQLILCGKGDAEHYIFDKVKEDTRIVYYGQVTPQEAYEKMLSADVLINPRNCEGEYTKYSFPSKNIEYLLTGKEVVGYNLAGIPNKYKNYMHFIESDIAEAIQEALREPKNSGFLEYAKNNLDNAVVVKKIIDMMTEECHKSSSKNEDIQMM